MQAEQQGRQALEGLSKLGIAARGLVWLVLSLLAGRVALGGSAEADQTGALRTLSGTPFGGVLLAVLAVGFLGYAVALVRQAVVRDDTADRLKAAGKAVLYVLAAVPAARLAVGGGGGSGGGGGQDPQPVTARLLQAPFGRVLVGLAALVVLGVGVWLAVRAVRRTHEDRIRTWGLSAGVEPVVQAVGVVGHLGRALVVLVLGAFVGLAALRADPSEAKGLDAALQVLAGEPHGPLVLGAVVLGALAYALWSFAEAVLHRRGST